MKILQDIIACRRDGKGDGWIELADITVFKEVPFVNNCAKNQDILEK